MDGQWRSWIRRESLALLLAQRNATKVFMKTLTPAKACKNLSDLLSRAVRGEDIGILDAASGQIVALRPVRVYSEDYALVEYGLTQAELKRAVKNIKRLSKNEKSQPWDGTAKGLLG